MRLTVFGGGVLSRRGWGVPAWLTAMCWLLALLWAAPEQAAATVAGVAATGGSPERKAVEAGGARRGARCGARARRARRARRRACPRPARVPGLPQGSNGRRGDGGAPGGTPGVLAPADAAPCANSDMPAAPGNQPAVADAILCLVNAERHRQDLAPLAAEPRLAAAARIHARDMVSRGYFGHASPEGGTGTERALEAGYPATGTGWRTAENIGWALAPHHTARAAVSAWMASSTHRSIILSPAYRESGAWVEPATPRSGPGATYVQLFGTPATRAG